LERQTHKLETHQQLVVQTEQRDENLEKKKRESEQEICFASTAKINGTAFLALITESTADKVLQFMMTLL